MCLLEKLTEGKEGFEVKKVDLALTEVGARWKQEDALKSMKVEHVSDLGSDLGSDLVSNVGSDLGPLKSKEVALAKSCAASAPALSAQV